LEDVLELLELVGTALALRKQLVDLVLLKRQLLLVSVPGTDAVRAGERGKGREGNLGRRPPSGRGAPS